MSAERDKKMADKSEDRSSSKKLEKKKLAWTLQPVSFSNGTKDTSNNLATLTSELSDVHCFASDDLSTESITY